MTAEPKAVLIDALGTLVRMRLPGPLLQEELGRRGVHVSESQAAAAFRAEIEWYRAHHLEGRDADTVERLRDAAARVLADALPQPVDPSVARDAMTAALRFEAYEDAIPALLELRSRGLRIVVVSNWDASLPEVLSSLGILPFVDEVVTSGAVGAQKPERAIFEAALAAAGCEASEAVHVGDSRELDVAGAEAAGIRAILLRRGRRGAGLATASSLRDVPRLLDRTVWPAWFAPVGLLAALAVALIGAVFVGGITEASGGDAESPSSLRLATLVQDAALVGAALWLAAKVRRPTPDQFGLRRTAFWPALGWTALAGFAYLTFGAGYVELIGEPEEQTTLEDLGAESSTATLVYVGLMVIVLAPFIEEFFFRGFFYGALRSRFSVLTAAAIDGLVFGGIHAVSGLDAVPPLAALGFVFCLVYERTGSLWPVIVLHALNNWISYGVQTGDGTTASVIGVSMVAACLLLAQASRPAPPRRVDSPA